MDIFSPYTSVQVDALQAAVMLRYEQTETSGVSTLMKYYELALDVVDGLADKPKTAYWNNITLK